MSASTGNWHLVRHFTLKNCSFFFLQKQLLLNTIEQWSNYSLPVQKKQNNIADRSRMVLQHTRQLKWWIFWRLSLTTASFLIVSGLQGVPIWRPLPNTSCGYTSKIGIPTPSNLTHPLEPINYSGNRISSRCNAVDSFSESGKAGQSMSRYTGISFWTYIVRFIRVCSFSINYTALLSRNCFWVAVFQGHPA